MRWSKRLSAPEKENAHKNPSFFLDLYPNRMWWLLQWSTLRHLALSYSMTSIFLPHSSLHHFFLPLSISQLSFISRLHFSSSPRFALIHHPSFRDEALHPGGTWTTKLFFFVFFCFFLVLSTLITFCFNSSSFLSRWNTASWGNMENETQTCGAQAQPYSYDYKCGPRTNYAHMRNRKLWFVVWIMTATCHQNIVCPVRCHSIPSSIVSFSKPLCVFYLCFCWFYW